MHNTAHNAHSYNTQAHTAQACVRSVVHSNATVKVSKQMRQYAVILQRAATLFEQHYNNALFNSEYDDEDLLAFVKQHDKAIYAYMRTLAQYELSCFNNVLFAVLRYNERCAS